MHLVAEASHLDATVSPADPFTAVILVACGLVTVAMVGLVAVVGAALTGRAD
ncbi:hypothetical protein [Agrococcus jejuensis]|uniref:Uncharacterized protein n=1 Tax=Agrococcus jejuensis TaxID=399736 RepID=A0A1G8FEF7_9MICO|nr:hypothetical protein [Agrococcus jejuensis]SDH80528.1 hypothetical protein SAMN04489720_2448 [Agrococcus jejuensis]